MLKRIGGLFSFLLAGGWYYRWDVIRSFLYDRGFHLMGITDDGFVAQWGVTLALVGTGLYLFWLTGKRKGSASSVRGAGLLKGNVAHTDTTTPYWRLRELFAHLGPHLPLTASVKNGHSTIGTDNKNWEAIGDEVLKQLSIGRLNAIGVGYRNLTQRLNPAPIPQTFWQTAKFTYWFLDNDGNGILDAKNAANIEYSDIEVNRAEANSIWPIEPWPDFKKWDERKEFELYEAACLWFNLEARLPMPERASIKYNVWRSQIFGGGIPVITESVRHAVQIGLKKEDAVTPHTKIDREILVTMAEHEGAQPLFLFRHKRGISIPN